jgi:hypothetical protein
MPNEEPQRDLEIRLTELENAVKQLTATAQGLAQAGPVATTCVICQPSCVICHPTCVICHPTCVTCHPTCVICHPTCVTCQPCRPTCVECRGCNTCLQG